MHENKIKAYFALIMIMIMIMILIMIMIMIMIGIIILILLVTGPKAQNVEIIQELLLMNDLSKKCNFFWKKLQPQKNVDWVKVHPRAVSENPMYALFEPIMTMIISISHS